MRPHDPGWGTRHKVPRTWSHGSTLGPEIGDIPPQLGMWHHDPAQGPSTQQGTQNTGRGTTTRERGPSPTTQELVLWLGTGDMGMGRGPTTGDMASQPRTRGQGPVTHGGCITSEKVEVIRVEELEAKERENDLDREGPAVHKVPVEYLQPAQENRSQSPRPLMPPIPVSVPTVGVGTIPVRPWRRGGLNPTPSWGIRKGSTRRAAR